MRAAFFVVGRAVSGGALFHCRVTMKRGEGNGVRETGPYRSERLPGRYRMNKAVDFVLLRVSCTATGTSHRSRSKIDHQTRGRPCVSDLITGDDPILKINQNGLGIVVFSGFV